MPGAIDAQLPNSDLVSAQGQACAYTLYLTEFDDPRKTAQRGEGREMMSTEKAVKPGESANSKANVAKKAPKKKAKAAAPDRKSTRLNSSHLGISYAVFC